MGLSQTLSADRALSLSSPQPRHLPMLPKLLQPEQPVLWVSEPDFRGTFGIFSLCFNTLLISVWSAVHMDIPTYRPTKLGAFINSVLWMAAALFCPELLLFIAINQWSNARIVVKKAAKLPPLRKSHGRLGHSSTYIVNDDQVQSDGTPQEEASDDHQRQPFTLVHGFYASMGGYVFDFTDDDDIDGGSQFMPPGSTRMALTSQGVCFLMQYDPDLIPDLTETSITDRTQASSLSKALLIAQVAWFCTNCFFRIAQHLPLSLLEVSTVAHGLCTLLTYFMWWSKPLNLVEPTLIRGARAKEACALMLMCSTVEHHVLYGVGCVAFPAEMNSIMFLPVDTATQVDREGHISVPGAIFPQPVKVNPARSTAHSKILSITLRPGQQTLSNTGMCPKRDCMELPDFLKLKYWMVFGTAEKPWHVKMRKQDDPILLQAEDIRRWTLACAAIRRYGLDKPPMGDKPLVTTSASLQSSTDFKGRGLSGIIRSNLSALGLALTYGVPHFLGWNAQLPTALEQLLWRISTVVISCWGAGMAFTVTLIVIIKRCNGTFTGERRGETRLVTCASVPYIAMSGFLLFESIRQLFFLGPEAYNLPSWSNYWPHFS